MAENLTQILNFKANFHQSTKYYRLARAPLEIWQCLYLTIGWNFWTPCRPIANPRACAYRLKCSPIKIFWEKFHLKSSLSKIRFNLEFSCHKTTKL